MFFFSFLSPSSSSSPPHLHHPIHSQWLLLVSSDTVLPSPSLTAFFFPFSLSPFSRRKRQHNTTQQKLTKQFFPANAEQLRTPLTDLFKIQHPVLLAGMNVAAGPRLAAAVTNAGGLGVIGGVGYTPEMLREQIAELKSYLDDKNAPFGVDLLLPQVGGSARKTK